MTGMPFHAALEYVLVKRGIIAHGDVRHPLLGLSRPNASASSPRFDVFPTPRVGFCTCNDRAAAGGRPPGGTRGERPRKGSRDPDTHHRRGRLHSPRVCAPVRGRAHRGRAPSRAVAHAIHRSPRAARTGGPRRSRPRSTTLTHERSPDRPIRTPRPRGEGQWGLGYHEPLNTAEQIKKEDDGLAVRERVERIFAPGGSR